MVVNNLRFGIAGSSLNNRDQINGSALPCVGLMRELQKRGHSVFWMQRDVDQFVRDLSPAPVVEITAFNVDELASKIPLDILVVQNYAHYGSRLVASYRRAGTLVLLMDDNTPKVLKTTLVLAKNVHAILTHGEGAMDILKGQCLGVPIFKFFQATDPQIFCGNVRAERDGVVFVGAQSRQRDARIKSLFFQPSNYIHEMNFKLYGLGWGQWSPLSSYPNVNYGGWVSNSRLPMVYAGARVGIHGTTRALRGCNLLVNRIFDLMASGCVVLADDTPGVRANFEVGKELLVSSSCRESV